MERSLFLVGAGIVAGVIGSAGGITSLVSYAALLAIGVSPLAANVTNSVALLGSGAGSALRARPDLDGHGETLRRWMPVTVVFSLAGGVLLVSTPPQAFNRVVPFLVAIGALVLLLQPVIASSLSRRGAQLGRRTITCAGACVAIYNGYFGAGAGILMIALLLLSTEPVLHRANALKNVILLGSDVLPAVLFAVVGTVVWHAVWPMSIGALAGGLIGPSIARRIPASIMRVAISIFGFGFAVWLLLKP
jgi:uncharacterized membrane protein YfcA